MAKNPNAPKYPKMKYHPDYEPIRVMSEDEEDELEGWYDNPGEYGDITHPSAAELKFTKKFD